MSNEQQKGPRWATVPADDEAQDAMRQLADLAGTVIGAVVRASPEADRVRIMSSIASGMVEPVCTITLGLGGAHVMLGLATTGEVAPGKRRVVPLGMVNLERDGAPAVN